MSVEPRDGRGVVTMSHPAEPVQLADGSVGLWWTALRGRAPERGGSPW
jgi:hypothetical protein